MQGKEQEDPVAEPRAREVFRQLVFGLEYCTDSTALLESFPCIRFSDIGLRMRVWYSPASALARHRAPRHQT